MMAEYIRLDCLWKCETCFYHRGGSCSTWCDAGESYRPAYSVLKFSAVEAEPVVRCKDCKKNPNFLKTSGKHMVWCRKWRCEVKDTDFCSYGERRSEVASEVMMQPKEEG